MSETKSHDILVADATVGFQKEIDTQVQLNLPRIDTDPNSLHRFSQGDPLLGSFKYGKDNIARILTTVLTRAIDTQDIAHSAHAEHHETLADTLNSLVEGIHKRKVVGYLKKMVGTQGTDHNLHTTHRLVLEGESTLKDTHVPQVYREAMELQGMDLNGTSKKLRKIADAQGVTHATMIAVYAGLSPLETFDALSVGNNQGKPQFRFLPGKINLTVQEIIELQDKLTYEGHPRYGKQPFQQALELISKSQIFPPSNSLSGWVEYAHYLAPLAIFPCLDEIIQTTQGYASERYQNSARDSYIDRFHDLVSTQLLTSYFRPRPYKSASPK